MRLRFQFRKFKERGTKKEKIRKKRTATNANHNISRSQRFQAAGDNNHRIVSNCRHLAILVFLAFVFLFDAVLQFLILLVVVLFVFNRVVDVV